ncbi:MAG: hypothetical protein NVS1B11_19790 [Terriglobales bacterium]
MDIIRAMDVASFALGSIHFAETTVNYAGERDIYSLPWPNAKHPSTAPPTVKNSLHKKIETYANL